MASAYKWNEAKIRYADGIAGALTTPSPIKQQ